jgi:hypothetical protein
MEIKAMANEQKETLMAAYKKAGFEVKEVKPSEKDCNWELNAGDGKRVASIICWENNNLADEADYKYKTKAGVIHARHGTITVHVASAGSALLTPFRNAASSLPAAPKSDDLYVPPRKEQPKEEEQKVIFFNDKGHQIGDIYQGHVMNTSFNVGTITSQKTKGGTIKTRADSFGNSLIVGYVNEEGTIYHDKKGFSPIGGDKSIPKSKLKEAEQFIIGRVETNGDVGIVYEVNSKKAGEVHGAGDNTKVYGGALLALLVNVDPKNAPFSQAFKRYEIPKPPIGSTYDDLSDTEKIERAKYDIYEPLVTKNGLSKAKAMIDAFNQEAEQANDKVAYWEAKRKSICGSSFLKAPSSKSVSSKGSSLFGLVKKILK